MRPNSIAPVLVAAFLALLGINTACAAEQTAIDPCRSTPHVTLGPQSQSIGSGESATLSWSVQAPKGCGYSLSMVVLARPQINLSPGAPRDWAIWTSSIGVTEQPQGSLQVKPAFNTVYVLVVAWGANSSTHSDEISVAVSLPAKCVHPPTPPTPSISLMRPPAGGRAARLPLVNDRPCRSRVIINANNLAPLLVQALGTPNTTVIVADGVELDLTPHLGDAITIENGVQLIGGRIAEPGKRFQQGPRLFVTPNPNVWDPVNGKNPEFQSFWPDPLFRIVGDNVRISGVRLEGPGSPPDAWHAAKIGYASAIVSINQIYVEIDHNEFSGWNRAAVEPVGTDDPAGPNDRVWKMWTSKVTFNSSGIHYPAGVEPVYIHDNYFHDNWYPSTPAPWSGCSQAYRAACAPYFGYGVVVSGSHALIERNSFDDYYHAIAANGCPGSGYRAYRNLVFANGAGDAQAFDVHHSRLSCASTEKGGGNDFDLWWNSFLYTDGPAFRLGGTPTLAVVVGSNVFAHDHVMDDAVVVGPSGDWGKVWTDDNNLEGVKSWADPSHHSESCDFDGDGVNDRFLTTGETWWFRSGDRRDAPWVYLNTNTLLVENVSLGYFSTDSVHKHVCDVATIDGGYKGGTGQYGPLN